MLTKEASLQRAYQAGAQKALVDAGLVKEAFNPPWNEPGSEMWPALLGPVGGAIAAPEGKGWRGAGGALGGGLLGAMTGEGAGALLAAIAARNPDAAFTMMRAGGLGGGILGSALGFRGAVN